MILTDVFSQFLP